MIFYLKLKGIHLKCSENIIIKDILCLDRVDYK